MTDIMRCSRALCEEFGCDFPNCIDVEALLGRLNQTEAELAIAKQEATAYRISLKSLEASLPKIKADAFKQGVVDARDIIDDVDAETQWGYDGDCGAFSEINNRLDKLEAGE